MTQTILIIGASPTARVALPSLLRDRACVLVCAPDVLAGVHVAERLPVNFVIADAAQAHVGPMHLTALLARVRGAMGAPVYVLRHADRDGLKAPVNDADPRHDDLPKVLARFEAALDAAA
jgi:hypothetical protein